MHLIAHAALAVAVAASAAGCSSGSSPEASPAAAASGSPVPRAPAPVTSSAPSAAPQETLSPGPEAAGAPARLASPARPGTVSVRPGPFDDRFALRGSRLRDGVVRTELTVTSDVSELVVLEVQAAYYDARGRLLSTSRATHAPEHDPAHEGPPEETVALRLAAPAQDRARVSSAVLSVPVLVNE